MLQGGNIMKFLMLLFNLLIPAVMIIAGRIMHKHCPKDINWIYGYRTARSMKNMDTWTFAHEYCGKLWWKIGWWMLVPSVLVMIPFWNSSEETVATVGRCDDRSACRADCLHLPHGKCTQAHVQRGRNEKVTHFRPACIT